MPKSVPVVATDFGSWLATAHGALELLRIRPAGHLAAESDVPCGKVLPARYPDAIAIDDPLALSVAHLFS